MFFDQWNSHGADGAVQVNVELVVLTVPNLFVFKRGPLPIEGAATNSVNEGAGGHPGTTLSSDAANQGSVDISLTVVAETAVAFSIDNGTAPRVDGNFPSDGSTHVK